eukprot:Amastigsp_a228_864.p1 type:complete len:197 gc:universal Amastigsp_a228_864:31-621(+)
MRVLIVALAALACIACLPTQVAATTCPNPPVNTTVVWSAFLGEWYQLATSRLSKDVFEQDLVCVTAGYALESSGDFISVNNSGRKGSPDGPLVEAEGKAKIVAPGKLAVTFGVDIGVYAPYWITQLYGKASSGYEVAVIYSCNQILGLDVQWVWILSRTPELPAPITFDSLYATATSQGIPIAKLGMNITDQTGCW